MVQFSIIHYHLPDYIEEQSHMLVQLRNEYKMLLKALYFL